jgi:cytochrome d ubiquinol oxidase subunit II
MQITLYVFILLALGLYVVMDGFDLGIGTLSLFDKDDHRRFERVEHVATVWDANESWILLIAMGLWGAFPAAYGAILPALYVPLVIMLFALIVRGYATEQISQYGRYHRGWGAAWGVSSLVTAFAQGTVIGGVLTGIDLHGDTFAGGPFTFLHNGFPVLTGATTVALYSLTGAAWLYYKGAGADKARAARLGRVLVWVTAAFCAACALLVPAATSAHLTWKPAQVSVLLSAMVLAICCFAAAHAGFRSSKRLLSFGAIAIGTAAGITGAAAMFFPLIAAPSVNLYRVAAQPSTLVFMLVALAVIMPVTLAYTAYGFVVFHDRKGAKGRRDQSPTGGGGPPAEGRGRLAATGPAAAPAAPGPTDSIPSS